MTAQQKIRNAIEHLRKIYGKRPDAARGGSSTKITLRDGLACEAEQGQWRLLFDQPESMGGDNRGPDPGFAGRASLGVCLAQGYAIAFAEHGIETELIEVEVTGSIDMRGFLGVDSVSPGYSGIVCAVTVKSNASPEQIEDALARAEATSPWLTNIREAVPVARELTLL
jgi:uncharacterized OsmC-like protein